MKLIYSINIHSENILMSKAASSATASGAGGKGGFGGSLGKAFKNKVSSQMLINNLSKTSTGIDPTFQK